MGGGGEGVKSQWLSFSISFALATMSASTAISLYLRRKKSNPIIPNGEATEKIQELEASLKGAVEKCAAERQGRIRAQKALREALSRSNYDKIESSSYPMAPIAVVRSCFSTRNGTPRQPLLVPLAKASLMFDPARVPQASLEGLEGYSHCWIIYVFHLNTDLEKLWKHPSQSKFKAKVRVPRLKGERIGVFATRSPHRLCPIGLTVAKVEAVHGHMVVLSGVDLVDGTPVLDIKPYLPYCDNIRGAVVPDWVKVDNVLAIASVNFSEGFSSSLADCWLLAGKKSLYSCPDEFESLIRQVLSWDIRSVSQRSRPHKTEAEAGRSDDDDDDVDDGCESGGGVVYHLILEGLDVSYRIDSDANVFVEKVAVPSP
ncbi:methyltransferase [Perilla frutescens var. hirtella]|nr:methyltransferase [Perilla frutescens var. hirtella]